VRAYLQIIWLGAEGATTTVIIHQLGWRKSLYGLDILANTNQGYRLPTETWMGYSAESRLKLMSSFLVYGTRKSPVRVCDSVCGTMGLGVGRGRLFRPSGYPCCAVRPSWGTQLVWFWHACKCSGMGRDLITTKLMEGRAEKKWMLGLANQCENRSYFRGGSLAFDYSRVADKMVFYNKDTRRRTRY